VRKLIIIALTPVAVMLLVAFSAKPPELNVPGGWPKPVYNFKKHPLDREKVKLGRALFYEALLSRDSTISCSNCHLSYTAFTHVDHKLSHGIKDRIGTRNAPALMNLAWSKAFMWDGVITDLDKMAQAPITNPLEMDATWEMVTARLSSSEKYRTSFSSAFGPGAINGEKVMEALSQFMLTFISASAKYDKVMAGTDTFTRREAHGLEVFRQRCASCHIEPLFTNGAYEYNGLTEDTVLADKGRMMITGRESDYMKYKVPSLRNVEVTYPYMHDGRYRNLQMVVFHYSEVLVASPGLSPKIGGAMRLTEEEKNDLVLFLKTLTDEQFIKDKNLAHPAASL